MSPLTRLLLCLGISALFALPAHALITIPEGNRSVEQPAVPGGSAKRTKALSTTYERKFAKVYDLLESDARLRRKISATAKQYDISPLHIAGAIIGEHTYNVDAYDRLQTYYVKALSYLNTSFNFDYDGESIDAFIAREQFKPCLDEKGSYAAWTCREAVWTSEFQGKTVNGKAFPNDRLAAVFFQPFFAGQTFGLGQLSPLTALQMSDLVHEVSGHPTLDHRNAQKVYNTIMDPDLSLAYIAATLKKSIDAYRDIAGFDISGNPGITSTLYNLGNPEKRAKALKRKNLQLARSGKPAQLPRENYYGWLVNEKLSELEALFSIDSAAK